MGEPPRGAPRVPGIARSLLRVKEESRAWVQTCPSLSLAWAPATVAGLQEVPS